MDVGDWLRKLGLEQYQPAFRDNNVDAEILPELTADDLIGLGVSSIGHRRKLLAAIAALRTGPPTAAQPPQPAREEVERRAAPISGEAERRQLTVMFCDLVGSTALSARLDPEDMREIIGAYHRCCADQITKAGGFVAKYMGDGVLAYFGYPEAHEDDAERAVRSALALIEAVPKLRTQQDATLQVRTGIATGLVVVGDLIGQGNAQERGVVGETPNLAARLQALAEPDQVVISNSTHRLTGGMFDYRDLGRVTLKGLTDPVHTWQVLGPSTVESRFEAHHGAALTPLVGREEELELLLRRWERAKAGDGSVVLISGEPGIGKSRLAQTLLERLSDEPHTRLRQFCSPHHQDTALYPTIVQLERAAGFRRDDTDEQRLDKLEAVLAQATNDLREPVPLLAQLLSLSTEGRYPALDLTPQKSKEKTLRTLVAQVEGLSARQPVLMLIEDAHWIDPTTLELLGRLIDDVRTRRVMLIVTFRPDFAPPWIGESHVTSLTLSPLGNREAVSIITALAGDNPLPTDLLAEIIERTDGIPLFIEEMTKALLEADSVETMSAVTTRSVSPSLGIPASLQTPLMARLDRLSAAKPVVQVAAALGREFSYALLAAVAGLSQTSLDLALDQLVNAGLLFRSGNGEDARFLFKHALIQDAAYGTLLRQARRDLHRSISKALIDKFPEIADTQPEILAHHFNEAGQSLQAVEWHIKAGQRALRRSASKEAVRQFNFGLYVTEAAPDQIEPRLVVELQTGLGVALTATSGYAAKETGEAFTKARQLCEKLNDTKALARVGYGQYLYHLMAGQVLESERVARGILALGEKLGNLEVKLLGIRTLGVSLFELGRLTEAHYNLEQGIHLMRSGGGTDAARPGEALVMIWTWLSFVLLYQGHLDEARKFSDAAMTEARRSRSAHTQAFSMGFATAISMHARGVDFLARATALRDLAQEQDLELMHGVALMFISVAHLRSGDSSGPTLFRAALSKYLATNAQWALPQWWAVFAAELPNDHPEKDVAVKQAFEAVETTQERWNDSELFRLRGDIEKARCSLESAEQSYLEAIRIADEQGSMLHKLRCCVSLAKLWQDQGRDNFAHEMLAPVVEWFAGQPEVPLLKEARQFQAFLANS